MPRIALLAPVFAALMFHAAAHAAPVNKCVINGSVTFQEAPCPATQPRRDPTLAELNAAEKQRRAAAASAPGAGAKVPWPSTAPSPSPGPAAAPAPAPGAAPGAFHCDGRQYCSQMRSCAEAQYFLTHCPGVKMDGDHNGIPCEKQWCGR
ncbi:excalibur calcium-binding domain-containing protein [Ideonella sp. 4Y16]|uniref:Excalibur calcium-binding domain-containing protein n=1 Tax=Ideonella alba TaxID=2824118 RepID=A0A941BCR0_9BURK|nr:excalibur calcium-binding domain-containing protein [Ideonella alba]MBQ0929416.1 excalibur calcium-binding domain-containing protein [Ideonella alba]MBQ0945527.1 excalibur calcium-binding domain-containing protein [Ideonella alba]